MVPAITDAPLERFPELARELHLPRYAADQLIRWLFQKLASSFEEMTDLSKGARAQLLERYAIAALEVEGSQEAADNTRKLLCRARDGAAVECVLIPVEEGRVTACLSTQVGCAMGCAFCRTARMGFRRNLTQGEIVGQLVLLARAAPARITNVVLMGMGEPLANLAAVRPAIEVFLDERAFNLSKRRITVSTAGLFPELESFAEESEVKIAISLNATTDEVRSRLMPINRRTAIAEIMDFCRRYSRRSKHRITFEYVLIRDVNDTREDAARLVSLLTGIRAKVNLIPFNPFEGSGLAAPLPATVEWWSDFLREKGVQANVRTSRGQEILAACGQLASEAVTRDSSSVSS
jgi:23S rRNA (adenine2503-C2)-methyltransferase